MSDYDRVIAKVRRKLVEPQSTPVFEPKKWRRIFFWNKTIYTNCYAYALDMIVEDKRRKVFIPGCISDRNAEDDFWSRQDIFDAVIKDLDFLGITYRLDDGSTKCGDGEYRIAIYCVPSFHDNPLGFHFARQDRNGEWSEKTGWNGRVQKIGKAGNAPPTYDNGMSLIEVIIVKVA